MSFRGLGIAGCVAAVLLTAVPARAQESTAVTTPADGANVAPPVSTSPAAAAPAASEPTDAPFKRVLPNFWNDLRRFPSMDTAIVLSLGGIVSAAAYQNDDYYVTHAAAGGTDDVFAAGGNLGNGAIQLGIAVGTYAVGRFSDRPAAAHVGADLIRAQILSGVLTHTLKLATRRTRPTGEHESGTDTFSFPSGHAASIWTTSTVLWRHLGWKVGAPASLVAAFASVSRLQQNQHYLSDVLFGAALGVASGRTVTMGHRRKVTIAPVPVAGGGAVVFSVDPQ